MSENLIIVGGGLAGSEAAWQAAQRGLSVHLYEMRPIIQTGAHQTDTLAELVCSNSLGSFLPDRASGILISELEKMGSLLIECARQMAVPAGSALAVDRVGFSTMVTERLLNHTHIKVIREEQKLLPKGLSIIATGPLTSPSFSDELASLTGEEHLYFFDALSPIVEANTIDFSIAFRASRYDRGIDEEGDYINCPFSKDEYDSFVNELTTAERISLRSFESAIETGVRAGMSHYFESCLPVEIIAERGHDSLAFGPMRPVGLNDPRTGKRSHAVVQLRQDDLAGELYNLVGFQTNLTYREQRRIFCMIPGLGETSFARYGQMHRNTFLNSPKLLSATLQHKHRSELFFAGQITGVEGYLGNIATGLLAGISASRLNRGREPLELPQTTMLGALCHYITNASPKRFQPMKANLGILPPLSDGVKRNKRDRVRAYAARAAADFDEYWIGMGEELRIAINNGGPD